MLSSGEQYCNQNDLLSSGEQYCNQNDLLVEEIEEGVASVLMGFSAKNNEGGNSMAEEPKPAAHATLGQINFEEEPEMLNQRADLEPVH